MIGTTTTRRANRVAEIVSAAWDLAHEHGIGNFSLHSLARAVGIRQPSLYVYFDSKRALYDAMFADANRQLLERLEALDLPADPRAAVQSFMRTLVDFALDDNERGALMFQRPVPGFEPSPSAMDNAQQVMARAVGLLNAAGLESQDDIDCFVAMVAGVMAAQSANEPGGDRWIRHLDRLTDMYLEEAERRAGRPRTACTT